LRCQAAVDQPLEGVGLLERGQVDALHVGHQRDVERLGLLVGVTDDHRHLDDRGFEAGAVAPLAVDQPVVAVGPGRGDDQWLDQPVGLDGLGQPRELGLLDVAAGVGPFGDLDC